MQRYVLDCIVTSMIGMLIIAMCMFYSVFAVGQMHLSLMEFSLLVLLFSLAFESDRICDIFAFYSEKDEFFERFPL